MGMNAIKKAEDLYNEKIYFMEIKPHKAENGLIAFKENELFPVVFADSAPFILSKTGFTSG